MRASRPTARYSRWRGHGQHHETKGMRPLPVRPFPASSAFPTPGSSFTAVKPGCRRRGIVRRGVTLGVVEIYAWTVA
jgi:hypothetical protein